MKEEIDRIVKKYSWDESKELFRNHEEKEISIFEIFCMGVDFGQLLMEEERESEGLFDAFLNVQYDKKFSMPMAQTQTREVHSKKWFNAKRQGLSNFIELTLEVEKGAKFQLIK